MFATLALAACSSTPPAAPRDPDAYQGCGTDENWRSFNDQELAHLVKVDDTQATLFTTPAAPGMSFPSATKPTFAWQPSRALAGRMNGDASCPNNCSLCPTIPPACNLCGEHLPATSGDTYDLQFSVDGAVDYRLISTLQFFTPPDAVWSAWQGKTVTLSTVRIFFQVNDVAEGPFAASQPLTFSVGP
jgi:hypothetical protein